MVKRIDLDRLGTGGDTAARSATHLARHRPAGIAECLRRGVAEAAAGAQNQDSFIHVKLLARGRSIHRNERNAATKGYHRDIFCIRDCVRLMAALCRGW